MRVHVIGVAGQQADRLFPVTSAAAPWLLLAESPEISGNIRYRSPRLGNRKAQSNTTACYTNQGMGDRAWETRK